MIIVQSPNPPTAEEWAAATEAFRKHDLNSIRVLVFTEGGAPNATQRAWITDTISGKNVVCSIVTPSTIVRGVATALSWFNARVKAFLPSQVEQAYQHINATNAEKMLLRAKVQELRTRLGDDNLRSIPRLP